MTRTRLLLCQSDLHALAMLASMLRGPDYEVVEAESDRAAMRLLRDPPGLAVLGVDPSDPDALELLAYIRRKHPGMPVVVLFSGPHPDREREAVEAGAFAVLRLPVAGGRLRAVVAEAVESSGTPPAEVADEGPDAGPPAEPTPPDIEPVAPAPPPRDPGQAEAGVVAAGASILTLGPLKRALEPFERELIVRALRAFGGNRRETAKALDINRITLYKKMRRYGLLEEGER